MLVNDLSLTIPPLDVLMPTNTDGSTNWKIETLNWDQVNGNRVKL